MSRSYRFGDYRVIPAQRELWHRERLIALPPHVFDCLTYLLEHRERAVGRDELVAAVWGKTQVSHTLLGQTILRIRRELGDDAQDQQTLRTIPRFGYRWLAAVDVSEDTSITAISPAAPTTPADPVLSADITPQSIAPAGAVRKAAFVPRVARWLAAATLLVLAIAAVLIYRSSGPPTQRMPNNPAADVVSAVLPAAIEPGGESAWMRLGVMDMVATRLRSSGLPSVPSEDVVALLKAPPANRSADVREAMAAKLLITPRVEHASGSWQVYLDADDGDGGRYGVEAKAADVGIAARSAADKLLVALGRHPESNTLGDKSNQTLMRRIDAAVLADDPESARALIGQAPAEDQHSPDLRLRLAKIDFRGGRLDAARERLQTLLAEAPAESAPVLRASILNGLGAIAIRSDQPQQAELAFGEAIGLLESRAEPAQLGQAYLGRASAAVGQRRYEAATADYARARIALRQANDTLALIRVAANEGFVDLDQGRVAQALPQLSNATEGFQRWGALNEAIITYVGQIGCYLALLDNAAAMRAADAAELLAQRIENPDTLESLALARASALAAVGRLRESRELLDRMRRTSRDPIAIAAAGGILARLELEAGHAAVASELAASAVRVLEGQGYGRWRADAWLTQVRAAIGAGDQHRSADLIRALAAWSVESGEPRARFVEALARAELALGFGEAQWRAAFEAARDLASGTALPYEIAAAANSYAQGLLAQGDLTSAEVEVGRVTRWSDQDFRCALLEARLYAALGRGEAHQAALARVSHLAGERQIPDAVRARPISTRAASH